jgi:protein-S-isoprenylcysteine O-methyltransferase Ste14
LFEHLKRHAIMADAFFFVPAFFLFIGGMAFVAWDIGRREGDTGVAQAWNPVGLLLVVLGLAFVLVATFTLRKNYSSSLVIQEGHELVVHGIYRVVQHPIYLGAILVTLGVPIGMSSWIALPLMLLLIPLFVYRMRIEEHLLLEEFGDDYQAYMARTKRLVPFLY